MQKFKVGYLRFPIYFTQFKRPDGIVVLQCDEEIELSEKEYAHIVHMHSEALLTRIEEPRPEEKTMPEKGGKKVKNAVPAE